MLPSNGKVVVVDDDKTEAEQLLAALFQSGISVRYYNGRDSEMPASAVSSVRLIFLDFYINGLSSTNSDEDQVVQALKPVVEKLLVNSKGPYVIFAWTKSNTLIQKLNTILDRKPLCILDMDKSECLSSALTNAEKIQKIKDTLNTKLKETGSVRDLFLWENLVEDAASQTINQIWEEHQDKEGVEKIFHELAKANLGGNLEDSSPVQDAKAALQVLNHLMSDNIDVLINAQVNETDRQKYVSSTSLNLIEAAKLNSGLMISQTVDGTKTYPGNVYDEYNVRRRELTLSNNKHVCEDLLGRAISAMKKYAENNIENAKKADFIKTEDARLKSIFEGLIRPILVEVTPVCDHAQKKYLYHRIIPGFLVPNHYDVVYKLKHDDVITSSPIFLKEMGKVFTLFLNIRGFATVECNELDGKQVLFRIKKTYLFDYQHKTGASLSRPGNLEIKVPG